jgi:rhodanese-related sulfurtransferase
MSSVDDLLARARQGQRRLSPDEAMSEQHDGALLVDTRTDRQRARQGDLPGAVVIDRTVLEWRLDPTSEHRIPEMSPDRRVVVICSEGFSSGFAARNLRDLGIDATDVIGGVKAWLSLGLPMRTDLPDIRE